MWCSSSLFNPPCTLKRSTYLAHLISLPKKSNCIEGDRFQLLGDGDVSRYRRRRRKEEERGGKNVLCVLKIWPYCNCRETDFGWVLSDCEIFPLALERFGTCNLQQCSHKSHVKKCHMTAHEKIIYSFCPCIYYSSLDDYICFLLNSNFSSPSGSNFCFSFYKACLGKLYIPEENYFSIFVRYKHCTCLSYQDLSV